MSGVHLASGRAAVSAAILRASIPIAAVGTVVLAAASVALIALTPARDLAAWGFPGYDALFAVVYLGIAMLITTRRPENLIGWLFLVSALLSGVQTFADSYGAYALTSGAPGGALGIWISSWIWIPAMAVIVLIVLLFPNGRPASRNWRGATFALIPIGATGTLLWAVAHPDVAVDPRGIDPLGLASDHLLRALAGPSLMLLAAWFLVAAASLVARMRHGDAVERQQVKWLAFAAALVGVTLGASIVTTILPFDAGVAKATQILAVGGVLLIPISAGVAILRYRLYDIDVLINRTLVYGAVSAVLAATYLVAVVLFQALMRPFTSGSELAVAGSTLLVVALFQPLRRRVQEAVDRRFYRSRYDAGRTLDAFSARLRDDVDLDSVRADLVAVLDATVRPTHASVWLREP
jgi:hypothetical protein